VEYEKEKIADIGNRRHGFGNDAPNGKRGEIAEREEIYRYGRREERFANAGRASDNYASVLDHPGNRSVSFDSRNNMLLEAVPALSRRGYL
jgi:hypothetical protein